MTLLAKSADPGVKALANQWLAERSRPSSASEAICDLFVVHHPADVEGATALVAALRRTGWRVLVAGQDELSEEIAKGTRAVALLAGPSGRSAWDEKDLHSTLKLLARRHRPIVSVRLPGAAASPELPGDFATLPWVDLQGGLARAAEMVELALTPAPPALAERVEPGSAWTEPLTGIRFLWIPGGRFQMGGNADPDERPVHWVRVSPFWLGETPVTNRQYAVFLEKSGYEEPPTWRDKRFSAPEQPVVGVSWEDARAFCSWLAEECAQAVTLPSEAQWEFAARGTDRREYPWGAGSPDPARACFALTWQTGQPAPVGSFPAGRGPFGTLDQAGNVWEWCLDAWDEKAYAKRVKREEVDPVVKNGKGEDRALRGGAWRGTAMDLRAAHRGWDGARGRYVVVGFRVAALPSSTLNP